MTWKKNYENFLNKNYIKKTSKKLYVYISWSCWYPEEDSHEKLCVPWHNELSQKHQPAKNKKKSLKMKFF